ncbi:MAG: hypothetical protein AB1706_10150 [Pseudomonadota bacterium]
MLYLICGTKQNCIDWLNNVSQTADYTRYFDKTTSHITKTSNKGEITGLEGVERSFKLFSKDMPAIQEGWYCYLLDAIGTTIKTVSRIHFGGVVTDQPKEFISRINGNDINFVNLQASSMHILLTRILLDLPVMVNQNTDHIVKTILRKTCHSEKVEAGNIENPGRCQYARFNKDRYALSAISDLATLFDWQFIVEPRLTSTKAGCQVHFQAEQKQYAPVILNDGLVESLGPLNSSIDPGNNTIKNIITLPYYQIKYIDDERHQQIVTEDDLELNSTVTLQQKPANIEASQLYQADYSDGLERADELEQDIDNSSPPDGHTESEGYLVRGRVNDIPGLHFFDASGENPDYGDIGIISNPEYVLFEVFRKTAIRAKELKVNQLGDAIICAYMDITSENPSELFSQDKIICGLELKSNGDIHSVINGVSNKISGKSYEAGETYTFRNRANSFETFTTQASEGNIVYIQEWGQSDIAFENDDIVEIFNFGNKKSPIEAKVQGISKYPPYYLTLTEDIGSCLEGVKVRTKPKLTIEFNGGEYGEVSGREWTWLVTTINTVQTEINEIREVGFCIAFQKSLSATLKEFKAVHYPPIQVYAGSTELTCSTPDDSAEKDIDCIIESSEGNYHIRFFSDTKSKWSSGSILTVKYDARELHYSTLYDIASMKAIAEREGIPYESGDAFEALKAKGGREARQENISPNLMTRTEAFMLARKILKLRVQGDMKVKLRNLHSHIHGYIEPNQILTVDLSGYPVKEIPITRTEQAYEGEVDGVSRWGLSIEANIDDYIDKLIATSGKTAKRITDQSADDTVKQDYSYCIFESIKLSDSIYCEAGEVVDYLCDDDGNISDMRFVAMSD